MPRHCRKNHVGGHYARYAAIAASTRRHRPAVYEKLSDSEKSERSETDLQFARESWRGAKFKCVHHHRREHDLIRAVLYEVQDKVFGCPCRQRGVMHHEFQRGIFKTPVREVFQRSKSWLRSASQTEVELGVSREREMEQLCAILCCPPTGGFFTSPFSTRENEH